MLEKDDKIGDYSLVKFLGRGQFGEVWLAEKQLQFSTRKFRHALKFLSNLGDEINLKAAEAEIDTWIEASGHPNIMSVLDMLTHKEHIIMVSEFAEGGSLKSWLDQNSKKAPSYEKALEMMTGILRGIEHLHSRNIVHRDLKPDNILLQGTESTKAESLANQALNEMMSGNGARAKDLATDALQLNKDLPLALAISGSAKQSLGNKEVDYQLARADLERAVQLEPRNAFFRARLLNVYRALKQKDSADKEANEVLSLLTEPRNALDYYARGISNSYLDKSDEAISDYTKAIELNPQFAVAYNNRSIAYAAIKRKDLAAADRRKSAELRKTKK